MSILDTDSFRQFRQQLLESIHDDISSFIQYQYQLMLLQFSNLCSITDLSTQFPSNLSLNSIDNNRFHLISSPYDDRNDRQNPHDYLLIKQRITPYISEDSNPPTSIRELAKRSEELTLCNQICSNNQLDTLRYIHSDPFTNNLLINYLLADSIPTILPCYVGFKCQDYGYLLFDYPSYGSLDQFLSNNPHHLFDAIKQVIMTLDYLQSTYQFTHGSLTLSNINVDSKPLNYSYKKMRIDAPFTCKLTNFETASITIPLKSQPYRFYNRTLRADTYFWWTPFTPNINIDPQSNTVYYSLYNSTTDQINMQLRHMGIPFYLSYETYQFIISLLQDKILFDDFFQHPILRNLWTQMWLDPFDASTIYNKLTNELTNTQSDVSSLLHNVKLNCSVTSILLNTLS